MKKENYSEYIKINDVNLKNNKAITLISLVITIIILIILAGIAINFAIGKNGLITKAQETAQLQKLAEIKEKIGTDILNAEVEATLRGEKIEQAQIEDIISKYGKLRRRWRYNKIKR